MESDGRLRGVGGARARCRQKKTQERGDGAICASVRRREAMRCSAIKMRYDTMRCGCAVLGGRTVPGRCATSGVILVR